MRLVDARTGIETIPRKECLRLMAGESVGRVGVVVGGRPHVLPVNYVLDGDAIVFRTAEGTKLDGAARSAVAFEVDRIDPVMRSGWSVVVNGVADEVSVFDRFTLDRLESLPLHPWAPGEKPHVVRIIPLSITGRRVGIGAVTSGD